MPMEKKRKQKESFKVLLDRPMEEIRDPRNGSSALWATNL